jgi:ferredoxin
MTETYTVKFAGSGDTVEVSEKQTVLNACVEQGVVHEYSCRVGTCLACVARLVEGRVEQPGARGLSEKEGEEYVLTCMARPRSDLVLERDSYPTTTSEAYGAEETA